MSSHLARIQYLDKKTNEWIDISGGGQSGSSIAQYDTRIVFEVFTELYFQEDKLTGIVYNHKNEPDTFEAEIQYLNDPAFAPETKYVEMPLSRFYAVGENRLEVIIDDTFFRTARSGGVIEHEDGKSFYYLIHSEEDKQVSEIVAKYYTRVRIGGDGVRIVVSETRPVTAPEDPFNRGDMWIDPR